MNIVITGASKGLGLAIAERFAADQEGHTLLLCARNADTLQGAATKLQAQYPQSTILFYTCDVSVKERVEAFAKWVSGNVGATDILVNNAGSFIPGNVHDEPDGTLELMMNTNVYSAYYVSRLLLPAMMAAKRGHVFNMCSVASLQAYKNGGSYSISKFALMGFSKNLREEMKPHNIKVTAVYPGATMTDSWAGSGIDPQRIMEANDIAALVYNAANLSPQACVEDIIVRPQLGDL